MFCLSCICIFYFIEDQVKIICIPFFLLKVVWFIPASPGIWTCFYYLPLLRDRKKVPWILCNFVCKVFCLPFFLVWIFVSLKQSAFRERLKNPDLIFHDNLFKCEIVYFTLFHIYVFIMQFCFTQLRERSLQNNWHLSNLGERGIKLTSHF